MKSLNTYISEKLMTGLPYQNMMSRRLDLYTENKYMEDPGSVGNIKAWIKTLKHTEARWILHKSGRPFILWDGTYGPLHGEVAEAYIAEYDWAKSDYVTGMIGLDVIAGNESWNIDVYKRSIGQDGDNSRHASKSRVLQKFKNDKSERFPVKYKVHG